MSPLGHILEENAFADIGDLRLVPDLTTRCELPAIGIKPAESNRESMLRICPYLECLWEIRCRLSRRYDPGDGRA